MELIIIGVILLAVVILPTGLLVKGKVKKRVKDVSAIPKSQGEETIITGIKSKNQIKDPLNVGLSDLIGGKHHDM